MSCNEYHSRCRENACFFTEGHHHHKDHQNLKIKNKISILQKKSFIMKFLLHYMVSTCQVATGYEQKQYFILFSFLDSTPLLSKKEFIPLQCNKIG
jgi:hypothetical protein